jgi:hypothetical protein
MCSHCLLKHSFTNITIQWNKTCSSESPSFTQLKHVRLSSDKLSYLSVSNRNGATPHLNLAFALPCNLEHMAGRYTSVWYSVLNVLYVRSLLPPRCGGARYLDVSLCRSIGHFSRNYCCNDSRTVDCTNGLHIILVSMAKCSSTPAILNRFAIYCLSINYIIRHCS